MALTPDQWLEIKVKWETGDYTMAQLAEQFGISKVAVCNRIKKEKWQSSRTRLAKRRVVDKVKELIDSSDDIRNALNVSEQGLFKTEVLNSISTSLMADNVRARLLFVLFSGIKQIESVIESNPTGVYVKEVSNNSTTYERNTLFIKDLMYILKELNTTIDGTKPGTQVVVNNTTTQNDDKPTMAVNFIAK